VGRICECSNHVDCVPGMLSSHVYTNVCTHSIFLGNAIHLPFSFIYHVLCAHHVFHDPIECIGRKLDQTFIHIGSILFGYGLFTSLPCMVANTLLNQYFIYCLWTENTPFQRRFHIGISIFTYLSLLFYGMDTG